ncbi:MAG: haloacid dehalogenase-like hydrolase [Pseudoflavonifractor sp.]
MKHNQTRIAALALAFLLGVGTPMAIAATVNSIVPSTTKVQVDGVATPVDAYNIDNGNNYFKLRDFAKAVDVGVTWDKATDTASIDRTAHYKPDPTQMITGNWAPTTRARVQAVIDANADKGRYVVFDFDNTSVINDVEEALLIYQIENLRFKIDPAKMTAVLETQIPDLQKSVGKNADGKDITCAQLAADITADYTWLWKNYKGFDKGGKFDLNYIHATNQYQDFAAKLRYMYSAVGDTFDASVSYPWVTYLFTGMTPDEVYALAKESHLYWGNYGEFTEETWTSAVETPGKAGIVSVSYKTGLTFTDELRDLYATLKANKIDVYIISASFIDVIRASNDAFGYGVPDDRVFAMRNVLKDGKYVNEYDYNWGGTGKYAQTQAPGKSTVIKNFIAPKYKDMGPLMVFGDSGGDMYMMTDWMKSGDTQLGLLFNRYRKPTSDKMTWEASVKAVEQMGKADAQFVLQGRDENTGKLRPTEKSIMIGSDKEVLVRPAPEK